jgi:hypothetical protein
MGGGGKELRARRDRGPIEDDELDGVGDTVWERHEVGTEVGEDEEPSKAAGRPAPAERKKKKGRREETRARGNHTPQAAREDRSKDESIWTARGSKEPPEGNGAFPSGAGGGAGDTKGFSGKGVKGLMAESDDESDAEVRVHRHAAGRAPAERIPVETSPQPDAAGKRERKPRKSKARKNGGGEARHEDRPVSRGAGAVADETRREDALQAAGVSGTEGSQRKARPITGLEMHQYALPPEEEVAGEDDLEERMHALREYGSKMRSLLGSAGARPPP